MSETTAPKQYDEVLVSGLTKPSMLAAVVWVEGYDIDRKAWRVSLADLPQRAPAGSPPDRTALVVKVNTSWPPYSPSEPRWHVIDESAPVAAKVRP